MMDGSLKEQLLKEVRIIIFNHIPGKIVEINISETGLLYKIRYVQEDKIVCDWFYADEFEFK